MKRGWRAPGITCVWNYIYKTPLLLVPKYSVSWISYESLVYPHRHAREMWFLPRLALCIFPTSVSFHSFKHNLRILWKCCTLILVGLSTQLCWKGCYMHPHNDVKYLSQIRIFFIVCTTVTVYGEDPQTRDKYLGL